MYFIWIFYVCTSFNTASPAAHQISLVSEEDAGIEPRTTVAIFVIGAASDVLATSHPQHYSQVFFFECRRSILTPGSEVFLLTLDPVKQ